MWRKVTQLNAGNKWSLSALKRRMHEMGVDVPLVMTQVPQVGIRVGVGVEVGVEVGVGVGVGLVTSQIPRAREGIMGDLGRCRCCEV